MVDISEKDCSNKSNVLSEEIIKSQAYQQELQTILSEAEQILQGKYVFNNIWDMEVCDEPVSNPDFKWNVKYHDDPEWTFMFTRFDFSYKLIVAYELTGNKSYIDCGLKFVNSWYKDNEKFLGGIRGKVANRLDGGKNLAHRTIDLSNLVCNITDFATYCSNNDLIYEKELEKLRNIARRICLYILDDDREFKTQTNWGPMENAYVLYASERLRLDAGEDSAFNRLIGQLHVQIREDGSHNESSPMYLVEVLLGILKYIRFGRKGRDPVLNKTARQCCDYLRTVVTPDGCIPNIGDSDKTNISDIMVIAASLFEDDKYLGAANRNIRIEFVYKYQVLPIANTSVFNHETKTDQTVMDIIMSSDAIIENPIVVQLEHQVLIKDSNTWLLCSNIPNGPSGHKHCDYLSVMMYTHGKRLLIDSGRATYKNCAERISSKDPESHCTVRINGNQFWKCLNAWNTEQKIEDTKIKVINKNPVAVLMSCNLGNEVVIKRIVTYIRNAGLMITDITSGNNIETFCAYYPLAPDVELKTEGSTLCINAGNDRYIFSSDAEDLDVVCATCSERYNSRQENKRIQIKTKNRMVSSYFMLDGNFAKQETTDDDTLKYHIRTCNSGGTIEINM